MESYNSKYIKTWQDYLKDNPDITEEETAAMKAKIIVSEKMVFDFVIGMLL
jgi:uncharacterized protein YneF (UPF0154 family)